MVSPTDVKAAQQKWARASGIPFDDAGYVLDPKDNFFLPISEHTLEDYSQGGGVELGEKGGRGKMQALHSSSALACNIFEYWRQRGDRAPLQRCLGVGAPITDIQFEARFSSGLPGMQPNLDVVLATDKELVGVESKFLEPFSSETPFSTFSDSYFPGDRERWSELGLTACQELARRVARGAVRFRRLDVPQLLKHALGLWQVPDVVPSLRYTYFAIAGALGEEHEQELALFQDVVGAELRFSASRYQDLIPCLGAELGADDGQRYLTYLRSRYFPESGSLGKDVRDH